MKHQTPQHKPDQAPATLTGEPGVIKARLLLASSCAILVVALAYYFYFFTSSSVTADDGLIDTVVTIPSAPQRVGDPAQGKHHLLNSPYVDCGLPLRVFNKLATIDSSLLLQDRQGAGAQLPYFNNLINDDRGQQIVTNNCLTCHAAPLFGEIVIGLGNEFLDFTEDPSRSLEQAGILVRGEDETRAWKTIADRISTVAPYIVASTVGVNVANNLTFALMAHRDPETLAWSSESFIQPPDSEPLPVSVPPWWRMAKKNAMFYQGQARGDHARFMMSASMLCADGLSDIQKTDEYAADIRAYIASLKPPVYPFNIDAGLVDRGRIVFQTSCAGCHGNADQTDGYPNLLVPLDIIGTDPALAVQAAVEYRRFAEWAGNSYFGKDTQFVPLQGYMPPPLDGVWATGPFLHNGSVPSIEALLNSSKRPAYWRHDQNRQYDKNSLGWTFKRLKNGKDASRPHTENKWIYDTSLPGYANSGHLFGDALSSGERAAVLEYLKTL